MKMKKWQWQTKDNKEDENREFWRHTDLFPIPHTVAAIKLKSSLFKSYIPNYYDGIRTIDFPNK